VYSKGRVCRWWACDGIPLEESVTTVVEYRVFGAGSNILGGTR